MLAAAELRGSLERYGIHKGQTAVWSRLGTVLVGEGGALGCCPLSHALGLSPQKVQAYFFNFFSCLHSAIQVITYQVRRVRETSEMRVTTQLSSCIYTTYIILLTGTLITSLVEDCVSDDEFYE